MTATTAGATYWRGIIDTNKSASEVLAMYEAEAEGQSLPAWLMHNDCAGSCIGAVDYQAAADSLRSEAAVQSGTVHCQSCGDTFVCQTCGGTGRIEGVGDCPTCQWTGRCQYC